MFNVHFYRSTGHFVILGNSTLEAQCLYVKILSKFGPGRGTGCSAGVWAFRADAPSFKQKIKTPWLHTAEHGSAFVVCISQTFARLRYAKGKHNKRKRFCEGEKKEKLKRV